MSYKTIYHGGEIIVKQPTYHYKNSSKYNDYGLGFYCTTNLDMAKEWANRRTNEGFANKYLFDERNLKILDLCDTNKYSVLNWIAILVHNGEFNEIDKIQYKDVFEFLEKHYYVNIEEYDVVIGYRADDAYFKFPLMFIKNILTLDRLNEIYLNGNLGRQYVLISEKAFSRIKFVEAIISESKFHERYSTRISTANNSYEELQKEELKSRGKRIRDLMRESND